MDSIIRKKTSDNSTTQKILKPTTEDLDLEVCEEENESSSDESEQTQKEKLEESDSIKTEEEAIIAIQADEER